MFEVDHVVPLRTFQEHEFELANAESNLHVLCVACHRIKSARECMGRTRRTAKYFNGAIDLPSVRVPRIMRRILRRIRKTKSSRTNA